MSLEEEFKETIKKALGENAREEAKDAAFLEKWRSLRRDIHQALQVAGRTLMQELNIGAAVDLENGSSALLSVSWNARAQTPDHTLRFTPNGALKIVRYSSLTEDEVYEPASLTEEAITSEIKDFITGVIRERKTPIRF